ncbi:MAG: hypothetical protein ACRC5M_04700 [Anaeroplasmataceae bacterium]
MSLDNEKLDEKEAVLDNQELVTEQNGSSETVNETLQTQEEIVPHDVGSGVEKVENVEKVLGHIATPEEIVAKEGDSTDIAIDFSKIDMDEDGIPEFTKLDAKRILTADLAITNFEDEIKDARATIKEVRELLDIKKQEADEKEFKKELEEIRAGEDPESEQNVKKIQYLLDELNLLPKNNPAIKRELDRRELNAKKHIAVYQNISRKDIRKMQNDGTIMGLISSTSNAVFAQAYIERALKEAGEVPLNEEAGVIEWTKEMKALEREYDLYEEANKAFKELSEYNHASILEEIEKRSNESLYSDEIREEINMDGIEMIPDCFIQLIRYSIGYFDSTQEENADILEARINDIKINLTTYEDADTISEELRNARKTESRYIETVECLFMTAFKLYMVAKELRMSSITDLLRFESTMRDYKKQFSVENFEIIAKRLKYTNEPESTLRQDVVQRAYEVFEKKIDDRNIEKIGPYKKKLRENGLFSSFISYAFSKMGASTLYYGNPKATFEVQRVAKQSFSYWELIRTLMIDPTSEESFNECKTNVNAVSMIFSNLIRYFTMISQEKDIDLEWCAQFDPESELKRFYFDNKEEIDFFVSEFVAAKNAVSHLLCHNKKFSTKYEEFIGNIIKYINSNDHKTKKLHTNKKLKDKFRFMTDMAFANSYVISFKDYFEKVVLVDEKVNEFKKANENYSKEDFDKWYTENCKGYELESTEKVISSIIHSILGCSIIHAFSEFADYFEERNSNRALKEDVVKYLFNEFILESFAFRSCPKDKNYADYIREQNANSSFQSIDQSLQRDIDVNKSRMTVVESIFTHLVKSMGALVEEVCSEKKEEVKSESKGKTKGKKKKPVVDHAALKKSYKKKAKQSKDVQLLKNAAVEYKKYMDNHNFDLFVEDEKNVYAIKVFPSKDTKSIVRIDSLAKREPVTEHIEEAIIDKNNNVLDVSKSISSAQKIFIDKFTNLNEKWYYDEFKSDRFAIRKYLEEKEDGTVVTSFYPVTSKCATSLSERIRCAIDLVLKEKQDEILKQCVNNIKSTGVDFEGKDIVVKDNYKFDIKYLKKENSNSALKEVYATGNLNLYNIYFMESYSFEINYDIVNINKK